MYSGAAACFLWFALLCSGVLPYSTWQLYGSYIAGGMLLNGAIPLFFELTVECTYPVAEASSAGLIMLVDNLIQVMFLVVPIDKVGTSWMNWLLVAVVPVSLMLLLPMEERYSRLHIDNTHDVTDFEHSSQRHGQHETFHHDRTVRAGTKQPLLDSGARQHPQ